ncbi:hypothetical protein ACHAXA_006003 [Cyclostephanos tholiformis]|uniref:UDENN domain-containing protein n=1 Tax=Cyclostephanos tholiformis TaxID=382380 RepID=A0ABD3SRM8_9STRA
MEGNTFERVDVVACVEDDDDGGAGGDERTSDHTGAADVDVHEEGEEDEEGGDVERRRTRLLHEERFRREIIELRLMTKQDDDDEMGRWTVDGETGLPIIVSDGRMMGGGAGAYANDGMGGRTFMGRNTTMSRLHIAYRRRSSVERSRKIRRRRVSGLEGFDECDYFIPGIADVIVRYVRLRRSTVVITPPRGDDNDTNLIDSNTSNPRAGIDASNDGSTSAGDGDRGGIGGRTSTRNLSSLARHGVELLTAAAVNYALQKRADVRGGEHFFPDDDDDDDVGIDGLARVGGAPQCRDGERMHDGGEDDRKRMPNFRHDDTCNVDDRKDHDEVPSVRKSIRDFLPLPSGQGQRHQRQRFDRRPVILLRRNVPNGFADVPIAPAKVLDRFPRKNYRGNPFPEEELPLFCYPGSGVYLVRDRLCNWSLPKSFGFVVKNERGDSTYVSCLTFMEPLTKRRREQLDRLSRKRRETSLAHRAYCEKKLLAERSGCDNVFGEDVIVGFDDIVTFENKTICLLGRYPYWTQFMRFLTHLHLLSGSLSDIPLERNISHLLLSVPMPKPGGQCVLVPFSTMNEPMALVLPPLKDLPLVDLSYARLFGALDVPTVVTIVLGFLCLERKVILISTRQSLLLHCCELLKSLLFPFELCAPYVPLLTQPFMSCLEFPGAIFVGIHDDEQSHGLAKSVRENIPEDSIIVELDNGEIYCDKNRRVHESSFTSRKMGITLKAAYQIIPIESRTILIKELEALCQDAGIMPGQEPLNCGLDSAYQVIDSTVPFSMDVFAKKKQKHFEPLDERAVRDSFLRFFTASLAGYERFLVVPDADFLTSGNDWFDSSKFVAAASPSRTPFLMALVETQLFQSFVQRRTEASDVHCVLFDECLAEHHSSKLPYGRLAGHVSSKQGNGDDQCQKGYDLLVDQCATEPDMCLDDDESPLLAQSDVNKSDENDNDTSTQASSGIAESIISDTPSLDKDTPFAINASGDIVTCPSTANLPPNARYSYIVDGNGVFPTVFDRHKFFPMEPHILEIESSEAPASILTRSEREREDAVRQFNMTVSRRGTQKQHSCLWQVAKFMGSQFFGAYILCIPSQLSQPHLSVGEKSKILLRSLGALRTLRSHRRIVADEAAYRALIVACGKCGTDRRNELTKLYGLMRMDGILMNAVTLGCYTRAIAEGCSNVRNVDGSEKIGMHVIISSGNGRSIQKGLDLEALDNNLVLLEESGVRWRSGGNADTRANEPYSKMGQDKPLTISPSKTFDTVNSQRSTKAKRCWLPVYCSSSFIPHFRTKNRSDPNEIRLFALWSRATSCNSCGYIPLDEEIQSGWDVIENKFENSDSVACPRCTGSIMPFIGYQEMSIVELMESEATEKNCDDLDVSGLTQDTDTQEMPPQLESSIKGGRLSASTVYQGQARFVTYLSPTKLRSMLEDLSLKYGEDALNRDSLRMLNPDVFFNLWWYSARFSLPLPLSVNSPPVGEDSDNNSGLRDDSKEPSYSFPSRDYCAFASWDKTVALYGCRSGAKAILAAQTLASKSDRFLREKLFDNPYTDNPLLAFFNLQTYAQGDWDHPDFSEILVALVKACETRDFLPVIECVFQRNQMRGAEKQSNSCNSLNNLSFGSTVTSTLTIGLSTEASTCQASKELDYYRTILYLARYQCTTAFHAFFPTTMKPCKGFHFWCAQGTAPLPIFDRAFREAAITFGKQKKMLVPIPEISGVALGFRSVFGHII